MRLEYTAFQSRVDASHPELRANRLQETPATLERIAALLPDDHSAALEYLALEDDTWLFVLTRLPPRLRCFSLHLTSGELIAKVHRFSEKLGRRDLEIGADGSVATWRSRGPAHRMMAGSV